MIVYLHEIGRYKNTCNECCAYCPKWDCAERCLFVDKVDCPLCIENIEKNGEKGGFI